MNHTTHEDTAVQTAVYRPGKPMSAGLRGLAALALALAVGPLQAQQFTPPPPPTVAPRISQRYSADANRDRIDDELTTDAQTNYFALAMAPLMGEAEEAQTALENKVDVELVFKAPVTQAQIDAFLAAGGEITYIYKAVSYGWNGRIPLENIEALPTLMGAQLVLVSKPKQLKATLDKATRSGRVRPMWASGFAGSSTGFSGDNSITVGVLDTGIDGTHTDLTGRQVYWQDFTGEGLTNAQDPHGHGSHVTGIALGSGAVGGSATSTLNYSEWGGVSSVYPAMVSCLELPPTSIVFNTTVLCNSQVVRLRMMKRPIGHIDEWSIIRSPEITGQTPLSASFPFAGSSSNVYGMRLDNDNGMTVYSAAGSISSYPAVGDGFNKFRGVAPGCNWAGARVLNSNGEGYSTWIGAGIDDLVSQRVAKNVKVLNLSLGGGIDTPLRQKINNAVNNGIVVAIAIGNDGANGEAEDPGRAALALTVAASDDNNQLTYYTSVGFSNPSSEPGVEEDFKPDLMAPGGSKAYYTSIMSVDSNTNDASYPDQQPNDYTMMNGTSMASPFAAGCAALVIDAMQQKGITWDFASSAQPRYVKMLLCATASESNAPREDNAGNPTLQRAAVGPNGCPVGKDLSEGYGMINPDAAVEAVSQSYTVGSSVSETLGAGFGDKRVWARSILLNYATGPLTLSMSVPPTADYDMYLYSSTPNAYGTPIILASSTSAGNGVTEIINYTPYLTQTAILVVKRVSGSGSFTLSSACGPMVQFSKSGSSAPEQPGTVTATVTLSKPCSVPVSVPYSFTGTATNGSDYTATPGTLTFNAGEVSKTISATVLYDAVYEPTNETIVFKLNSATNAVLGSPNEYVHTINAETRPANDNPGGATDLRTMYGPENTSWVYGRVLRNAQPSSYTPSCAAGTQWLDVWYCMSLFPGMTLTATNGTSAQSCVAIYTSPTPGTYVEKACALHNEGAPANSASYVAEPGVRQVWVQLSAPDMNSVMNLQFLLHQNCSEAGTTKDVCAYAQTLSCGSGSIVGPLTIGATASPGQPSGLSLPDVWYVIYPSNNQPGLTISFADQGSSATPGFLAVYRGECGRLLLRQCSLTRDAQGKFNIIGMKAGQYDPIYIRIGSSSTATNQQLQVSCFDKTNP